MKIRVTLEMDFGETAVEVSTASLVIRQRAERNDGYTNFQTPGGLSLYNAAPSVRVVAAWEIERRYIPTVEPGE